MNSKKIRLGTTKRGRDLYLAENAINSTVSVIGSSGGGKTSALNYLAIQKCQAGEDVIIFDVHNVWDVSKLPKEMKSFYDNHEITINVGKDGIKIPLMEEIEEPDGNKETRISIEHRVVSLLKNAGELSPAETSETATAIKTIIDRNMFETRGIIVLKEFLDTDKRASANHAAGKLRALLEGNVIKSGNFIVEDGDPHIYVINMNGLEYDDQIVVSRFLQDFFLRLAMKKYFMKRGLTLFIDECQNYGFKQKDPLFTLLNEGRKHRISLVLATQSFTMAGKKEMAVILQAGTTLYFMPRTDERRAVARAISPCETSKWLFTIDQMQRGEFIACGKFETEDGKKVIRPQYMQSCYTREELEELGYWEEEILNENEDL